MQQYEIVFIPNLVLMQQYDYCFQVWSRRNNSNIVCDWNPVLRQQYELLFISKSGLEATVWLLFISKSGLEETIVILFVTEIQSWCNSMNYCFFPNPILRQQYDYCLFPNLVLRQHYDYCLCMESGLEATVWLLFPSLV